MNLSDNIIISEYPQGTPEWYAIRAGKATGSRAADILAKIKSGEAAARRNYRVQLVTERLTGTPQEDGFVSKDMAWGIEQEPYARLAYEVATGEAVEQAGFVHFARVAAGCSVDGFVGNEGFVELKCPKSATHITYLLGERLPPEYEPQVTHNLWVTSRKWCDFVSFDPRLPTDLRLFQIRVLRDEEKIAAYVDSAFKFLSEVDALEATLRSRHQPRLAVAA